ncbi:G-protein coupled receptor 151 protein-like [Paramacrobiotus metropolitanus]|uniref:G-protein coupled receptor 151 protein-like n=1 Tax=Paramacrobiotus metropolitanus TaxID=2943436 RepID=UPI002445A3D9|nr:G-protein coupled receptor 151 protein-like [Paramacrobiotus metropolitanus]
MNVTVNNTANSSYFGHTSKSLLTLWAACDLSSCIIGSFASLLVVILILSRRQLRHGCGLIIVHSLIANLLLCAISFVISCALLYRKSIGLGAIHPHHCKPIMWLQMALRCAVNWLEVLITLNRLIAIYFPHHYRVSSGKRVTAWTVAGVWLVSALYALPAWFDVGAKYALTPLGHCAIAVNPDNLGALNNVFGAYLPIALTAVCFGVIYGKLVVRKRNPDARDKSGSVKRRARVIPMLFAAFLWNAACFLTMPVTLSSSPNVFVTEPALVLLFMTLTVLGYSMQPVIFCVFNKDYRAAFASFFNKKSPVGPSEGKSSGNVTRLSATNQPTKTRTSESD